MCAINELWFLMDGIKIDILEMLVDKHLEFSHCITIRFRTGFWCTLMSYNTLLSVQNSIVFCTSIVSSQIILKVICLYRDKFIRSHVMSILLIIWCIQQFPHHQTLLLSFHSILSISIHLFFFICLFVQTLSRSLKYTHILDQ